MTTTAISYFKVGDRVQVKDPKFPGVWIVRSTAGSVNAKLDPERGGRGLRAPYTLLVKVDDDAPVDLPVTPALPDLPIGTLVRTASVKINAGDPAQLFTVIANRGDRVNIAKLGGDGDRYWRTSPGTLEVVDPRDVLK